MVVLGGDGQRGPEYGLHETWFNAVLLNYHLEARGELIAQEREKRRLAQQARQKKEAALAKSQISDEELARALQDEENAKAGRRLEEGH